VTVQMEGMAAIIVIVDVQLDDGAVRQHKGVSVGAVDGRVCDNVIGGGEGAIECRNLRSQDQTTHL
jgi:hypothetical protein